LIRLVVAASSSVLSVDDETKMNWKKHERSLLEVFSDVGSTPTASTIPNHSIRKLRFTRPPIRECGLPVMLVDAPLVTWKVTSKLSIRRRVLGIERSALLFPYI
jgi:hypothetical protein